MIKRICVDRKFIRILLLFSFAYTVHGCATPKDSVDISVLSANKKGIVFLRVEFANMRCLSNGAKIGKHAGEYYVGAGIVQFNNPVELEAGEYYLTQLFCQTSVIKTRQIGWEYVFMKAKYYSSYAKFTVREGEVTDAGKLIVQVDPSEIGRYRDQIEKLSKIEVAELTEKEKSDLSKKYPNLYSRAKTRLMTPEMQTLRRR